MSIGAEAEPEEQRSADLNIGNLAKEWHMQMEQMSIAYVVSDPSLIGLKWRLPACISPGPVNACQTC